MTKNILLAFLLAGSSLNAMDKSPVGEPRHGLIKTTQQTSYLVQDIAVQVHPSYLRGSTLFAQQPEKEIARHESALCLMGQVTSMRYLNPIKELGVYYIAFKEAVDLAAVAAWCKTLPGFEALHDIKHFKGDDATVRNALFEQRIKELSQANDPVAFVALGEIAKEEAVKLERIAALLLSEQCVITDVSYELGQEYQDDQIRTPSPTLEELDARLAQVDQLIQNALDVIGNNQLPSN